MIFNFKIILYLAKRIIITKKFLSFIIINIKYIKIIFLKILNSYVIIKLNITINFCFNKYKVITIIFKVIIKNNRYTISNYIIYYII